MAPKIASTLVECRCGHPAVMHHSGGYLGHRGADARGKCAADRCSCLAFAPMKAVDKEDAA